jgi:hypothetical protein
MVEKAVPNIFILLGMDPDKPWNQGEFESLCQKKRQEWSKQTNLPTERGVQARQNLGLMDDIRKIASDEVARKAHAEAARQQRSQEQSERLKQLDERLELLQVRGYLLQGELESLVNEYKLTEAQIRKRIRGDVEIRKDVPTSAKQKAMALDPSKAKDIKRKLQGLNKDNLYDFLELGQSTESRLLQQKADTLSVGVLKKGTKTANDTLVSELSGYCRTIFANDTERAKYDETLRIEQYDGIKSKIDDITKVSKKIEASQIEKLIKEAREKRLDPDEAMAVIEEYAAKRGFPMVIPAKLMDGIRQLRRCGYCGHLNAVEKKHCTNCSQPLLSSCPRCGKEIPSEDNACGSCGFPTGNRAFVMVLVTEAEQAQRRAELSQAEETIQQAMDAWSLDANEPLAKKIKALEESIKKELETQKSLFEQIDHAILGKTYYKAHEVLLKLKSSYPSDKRIAQYSSTIEGEIKKAEECLKRARETVNVEDKIRYFCETLSYSKDCQSARDELIKTPPAAPANLKVLVSGKTVRLSWQPSVSQGMNYTIVRKMRSRPISTADGEIIKDHHPGTTLDDVTATVGLSYYYGVFANREGVHSKDPAVSNEPVMVIADVANLVAQVSDRQVYLKWTPPPNCDEIVLVRSTNDYPQSIQGGEIIKAIDKSQAVDGNVTNNQRYFYTIFSQFKDASGKIKHTGGQHIDAIPQLPPQPIKDMKVEASGDPNARKIILSFPPILKGDGVVLRSNEPCRWELGSIIPQSEISQYGQVLKSSQGKVHDELKQAGSYYYVPVVLFQGMAYVGKGYKYVSSEDVTNISAQNYGHALRLQWNWPSKCREVIIAYSHHGWPAVDALDTITHNLTRSEYDIRGHFDILNPSQNEDYYVCVFAVLGQGDEKIIASAETPGARKHIPIRNRIEAGYELKKTWRGKDYKLHLSLKGKGTFPATLLVYKRIAPPIEKKDGEVILRVPAFEIDHDTVDFPLQNAERRKRGYVALFLEDDANYEFVRLLRPAINKLELAN